MLTDRFGRVHDYLRISLTDNCNFRCQYCMPDEDIDFHPEDKLMQTEEIIELAKVFVSLGVRKIRLTGGEPLIRKDFIPILNGLSALPVERTMTTNGFLVNRVLPQLKEAGVRSLNVSLDSLDPNRFAMLTKRDKWQQVWDNILLLMAEGFHVKLNCVVMKEMNAAEIVDFVALTLRYPIHVRFIEFMPFTGNQWEKKQVMTWQEMEQEISSHFTYDKLKDEPNATARKFRVKDAPGTFAVISTMSEPFCATCNRMRLTADGKMKNCLFSRGETDLLGVMREGRDVREYIMQNLQHKEKALGGQFISLDTVSPDAMQNRSMMAIGG